VNPLQSFYGPLFGTTRVSLYHKWYHTMIPLTPILIIKQLSPSIMIHSILPIQFTCLTVFLYNLCPSPLWSTSWSGILHLILIQTFLHPIIIVLFSQHYPYNRNLFCCSTEIMSYNPSLFLSAVVIMQCKCTVTVVVDTGY